MYADVIIDISHERLDRTFQYKIPEELQGKLAPGMVVSVPFGQGNRSRKAYVVRITENREVASEKLKEVSQIIRERENAEGNLIALASWMSRTYGSTMIQALKTVLPIQEKAREKEKKKLLLSLSKEEAEKVLETCKRKNHKARVRLLEALIKNEELDYTETIKQLKISTSVIKGLQEANVLEVSSCRVYRNPVQKRKREEPLTLTREQKQAAEGILQEWDGQNRPCLLFGVTGSGKTQVYMELIEKVLEEGRQVIVLIPEIALTYQTVQRFCGRFGEKISVINSRLSLSERYDQFQRAQRGEIQIIIGPRSALFTPFQNLGLILMDEEHEQSYKSENTPRYHARETAIKRAELEGAHVVLGSATPSLESYSRAKEGIYRLFRLSSRYGESTLPQVKIVDMRQELKEGNRSILSRRLKEAMGGCLERKEQIMLFLNRRGYAGFLSCRMCGQVMKCPHCDVSLSLHRNGRLICHYCGYETKEPRQCPSCGSPYIGRFQAGTQQIEEVVKKQFPQSRILRMDLDTTRKKDSYERILSLFSRGEADILIGTQMIVKGHDFPNVTLVGVLAADLSLYAEDYRCAEKTFQLLTQAVGRAGRRGKPGEAVIQTYQPEHYSIQAAVTQDYEAFFQEEYSFRQLMGYPPAGGMLAVLGSCREESLLEQAMEYISIFLSRLPLKKAQTSIIGPADQTIGKINDQYRKVIYIKDGNRERLIWIKDKLEQYIEMNKGFQKIWIQFDFS